MKVKGHTMVITRIKYVLLTILCLCVFTPQLNAKEINLFDGLIKIRTDDGNHRNHSRNDRIDRYGHYEIIDGRLVWVKERHKRHIIDRDSEIWVLLTRIQNDNFDWVIIPASNNHKIRKYLKRGYQRSMTGRKHSCYKMGKKKERLWEKHHEFWQ